jgi:hypothetical protein
MVNEGGVSVYMAAKELKIAYSTAKFIILRAKAAKTIQK